jgi:hypothetical protein
MIDDEVFMEHHSLFQRCLPPTGMRLRAFGAGRSGLDEVSEEALSKVLDFDYMGAAEFEHGECAKCLIYMYDNRDKLVATESNGYFFLTIPIIVNKAHKLWSEVCGPNRTWRLRHTAITSQAVGWFDFNNGFFVSSCKSMRDNLQKLLLEMAK